jgi:hypothetical protein
MKLMSKKVTIFGKNISAVLLALVAVAGLASAGLLTIYGRIVGTATVEQSVKLDGNQCTPDYTDCTVQETIPEAAPGGEKFCFEHHLTNDASVSTDVNLQTSCVPECDGITISYYNSFGTVGPFNTVAQPGVGEPFAHGQITKTDLSESIKWTFTITDQSDHYGVGLVIDSNNDGTPDYQIYFAEFGDKQWHYQPYGDTCWSGQDTTTLPDGVVVTGDKTGQIFTIEIPKTLLGGIGAQFGWMSQVRTNLLGVYPNWTPWCGPFVWESESTVGLKISNPITLQSKTTKDFYTCYDFPINIAPGAFTITTDVAPALT